MNVEYAGPLAGYQRDSANIPASAFSLPIHRKLIEPKQGEWPTLRDFLATLLDAENTIRSSISTDG